MKLELPERISHYNIHVALHAYYSRVQALLLEQRFYLYPLRQQQILPNYYYETLILSNNSKKLENRKINKQLIITAKK